MGKEKEVGGKLLNYSLSYLPKTKILSGQRLDQRVRKTRSCSYSHVVSPPQLHFSPVTFLLSNFYWISSPHGKAEVSPLFTITEHPWIYRDYCKNHWYWRYFCSEHLNILDWDSVNRDSKVLEKLNGMYLG